MLSNILFLLKKFPYIAPNCSSHHIWPLTAALLTQHCVNNGRNAIFPHITIVVAHLCVLAVLVMET